MCIGCLVLCRLSFGGHGHWAQHRMCCKHKKTFSHCKQIMCASLELGRRRMHWIGRRKIWAKLWQMLPIFYSLMLLARMCSVAGCDSQRRSQDQECHPIKMSGKEPLELRAFCIESTRCIVYICLRNVFKIALNLYLHSSVQIQNTYQCSIGYAT